MIKFIKVTTNFVDGSKQSEMTERISELKETAKIIGKIDNLEEDIQDIIEDYLIALDVHIGVNQITTLNGIPDKDRMTIRLSCGSELTIDEHIDLFFDRLSKIE
jgi:hypothetical protein